MTDMSLMHGIDLEMVLLELEPFGAAIILMLKNSETGFLEEEIAQCSVSGDDEYLERFFAEKGPDGAIKVHLRLIAPNLGRDFTDDEYDSILDSYDPEAFSGLAEAGEVDESIDPTWEFVFDFPGDNAALEATINELIARHKKELDEVYSILGIS
jgi:hypothetical protein